MDGRAREERLWHPRYYYTLAKADYVMSLSRTRATRILEDQHHKKNAPKTQEIQKAKIYC